MEDFGEFLEVMKQRAEEQYAKEDGLRPQFDTEEQALAYALRITQLRTGDKVRIPSKNTDCLINVIYTGFQDGDGDPLFLWYNPDTKRIGQAAVRWYQVVLD